MKQNQVTPVLDSYCVSHCGCWDSNTGGDLEMMIFEIKGKNTHFMLQCQLGALQAELCGIASGLEAVQRV